MQPSEIELAVEEVKRRTLASLRGNLPRLVYLASTRDYNSGRYHHEGLANRFTAEISACALAICHEEVFERMVRSSVAELVNELQSYIHSTAESPDDFVGAWVRLQPYRVLIPLDADRLSSEFFFSNLRVALAILGAPQESHRDNPRGA